MGHSSVASNCSGVNMKLGWLQADHVNAVLGEPHNKITKDSCLARVLTAEPGIMVDRDAMKRLHLLASHVHRIGKGLPEECSSALCAIAFKSPEVFGMDVRSHSSVASVIMSVYQTCIVDQICSQQVNSLKQGLIMV